MCNICNIRGTGLNPKPNDWTSSESSRQPHRGQLSQEASQMIETLNSPEKSAH
jgi:hypothetical protein